MRLGFRALVGIVAIAPLPFGAVHGWAWGGLAFLIGVLLIAWGIEAFITKSQSKFETLITWPLAAALLLTAAWVGLQCFGGMPLAWHHPLWRDAASVLHVPYGGAISLDPPKAIAALIKLFTYAGVFWLAFQHGKNPHRAETAMKIFAIAGLVFAIYGLIEQFSGTNTILWYPKYKNVYIDDLTSTFVNRNNYATYAGMTLLCWIGWLFSSYSRFINRVTNRSEQRRLTIVYFERRGWALVLAIILVGSALLESHSRGGFLATAAGVTAFCVVVLLSHNRDKTVSKRFGIACICLMLLVFFASGRVLDKRLAGTDPTAEERPVVYMLTAKAIGDAPFLGTGYGTFEEAFRFYRSDKVVSLYDYAHNTYLELAMELGVPAAAMLLSSVIFIVACTLRGAIRRRRDFIYPALGFAMSVLAGVHSLLDFSIQIPAVAVSYALILGLAYAQSWSSRSINAAAIPAPIIAEKHSS